MDKNLNHYVVVTIIPINKEGKYLITKRSNKEKAFPNKWTVPGGKLEVLDYALRAKDTSEHWYNIIENVAKRETQEETNLIIDEIGYITSLVYLRSDNIPCLIISLYANVENEEHIRLEPSLTDHKWVTLQESKEYNLIEGIYEEIEILDNKLKKNINKKWTSTQTSNL